MTRLAASLAIVGAFGTLAHAASNNFWRLPCMSRSGAARMDPLMAPGETSDHLHTIFGSGGFSESVTQDALLNSDCTSCQVTQDRSAYWTPPLMFKYPNGSTVMVNQDGGMLAYYFVYGENPQAFPQGFRMIAGNQFLRNFTGPVPDPPKSEWTAAESTQFALSQKALGFNCLHYNTTDEGSLQRHFLPEKSFLDENCWDGLRLELMFPSCWNGKDVDSHDHKSHMAYPSLVNDGTCPEGFDTRLTSLFFETKYDTQDFAGVDGEFIFSMGDPTGYGYHGDFIQGWQPGFLQQAMDGCTNPSGQVQDCPLFDLQSNDEAATCQFPVPHAIKHENPFFNLHGLLGDVPVQFGPAQATLYGEAASALATGLPGIATSIADAVSSLLPNPVIGALATTAPAAISVKQEAHVAQTTTTSAPPPPAPAPTTIITTTSSPPRAQPVPTTIEKAVELDVVYIDEQVVVELGDNGVPLTTLAPVDSAVRTLTTSCMTTVTEMVTPTAAAEKRDKLPGHIRPPFHHHGHRRHH
ncbi:hypothetical protein PISL3812_04572 [Talaromyces islandicus]|uniref:DUF1996 domain-containing protein n=1 Tax=Talaromyces islandicus TaxID=28573 RepID=A0A0U1LVW2_TALIS|nr:hypothetical protein PISL3812_04572 [Talaromyces islandicus]